MTTPSAQQDPLDVAAACDLAIRVLRTTRNQAIRDAYDSGKGASLTEISRHTGLARAAVTHVVKGDDS